MLHRREIFEKRIKWMEKIKTDIEGKRNQVIRIEINKKRIKKTNRW